MALSREEVARAKFTFSIYDFDGSNKIDAFQLGNALRALNLYPSLKRISNLGGTIRRNEKMLSVDEFLAIYQEAKKDKQEGTFEDYQEVLAGYDKDRSGKISASTLGHLLQGYGEERLPRDEAEEVIEDCGKPDDEGMVDYRKFLKNLLSGPEIKIPIAMLRATETETDSGRDSPVSVSEPSSKLTCRGTQDFSPSSPTAAMTKTGANLSPKEDKKYDESKSLSQEDNEIDVSITSEKHPRERESSLSVKSRNSTKSRESEKENSQAAINSDFNATSDDESNKEGKKPGSSVNSRKSSGKKTPREKPATSPDVSVASDTSGGDLTSARSSLKSGKSRSSGKTSESKEEPKVKAKFQQPLISLKTDGLFGKRKEQ